MDKKISFITAIIIIISLSLIVGVVTYYQGRWELSDFASFFEDKTVPPDLDCGQLFTDINQLITAANYCDSDSDCIVSTDLVFYECYILINKNADLSLLKDQLEKYNNCSSVVATMLCDYAPEPEDVACKNQKCVDKNIASAKQLSCVSSGGTVFEETCYCSGVDDFPSNCEIGGCTCNPAASGVSYQINSCECGDGKCFNGERCINPPY